MAHHLSGSSAGPFGLVLFGLWRRRMLVKVLNIAQSLLRINVTVFLLESPVIIDMGLPWLNFARKDLLDFFQGLACSLGLSALN